MARKNQRMMSEESNSMHAGFSEDEIKTIEWQKRQSCENTPEKMRDNMDISAAMEEAPVAKARTVTNLLSVGNNNQSNIFLNLLGNE